MIAVESSNRQPICQKLHGPSPSKLRNAGACLERDTVDWTIPCARAIRILSCNNVSERAVSPRLSWSLPEVPATLGLPLLFAIRLWASVCLALFIAFWLELDS